MLQGASKHLYPFTWGRKKPILCGQATAPETFLVPLCLRGKKEFNPRTLLHRRGGRGRGRGQDPPLRSTGRTASPPSQGGSPLCPGEGGRGAGDAQGAVAAAAAPPRPTEGRELPQCYYYRRRVAGKRQRRAPGPEWGRAGSGCAGSFGAGERRSRGGRKRKGARAPPRGARFS